jgi:hypothetical protein
MNDMSTTWSNTISEILTMMPYGFAWHEEVYKRREGSNRNPSLGSKYDDGRIGWKKLAGRAQASIQEWVFNEDGSGDVLAAVQWAPSDGKKHIIPMEKSLLFRTKYKYNNPEGRSLLRNAYRPWYFKKHIEEIEGIGIERDLAGLPVLTTPDGVDIWNPNDPEAVRIKAVAERVVRNIRRDENEGMVLPFGWDLQLLSTGSRRQFDTNAIVNRYDQRIAITLLADIVMLGGDKVGSFALADVKRSVLGMSLDVILEEIAEIFNRQAIPRLFRLNAFPGIKDYPRLQPTAVVAPNLNELARYVQALAGAKMPLFPDVDLEEYFRTIVGMPPIDEKTRKEILERMAEANKPKETNNIEQQTQGHPTGVDTKPDDGRMSNTGNVQSLGG